MKVIFLCTANSARSILAEALFRHLVGNVHQVFSCGAAPSGRVNPHAIEFLKRHNIPTADLHSKSYNDVPMQDALLVAVCDRAAGEVCPIATSGAHRINMPLTDPGAPGLSDTEQKALFNTVGGQLKELLANLHDQLSSATHLSDVVSPMLNVEPAA